MFAASCDAQLVLKVYGSSLFLVQDAFEHVLRHVANNYYIDVPDFLRLRVAL